MKLRTAALSALVAAGIVLAPVQADAARTLPRPIHTVQKMKPKTPRPELGNSTCRALGGHWLCLVWRYACPGEPFPPLSQGAIPACKTPGVYPVKTWRLVIVH